jgi:hypothetical protein
MILSPFKRGLLLLCLATLFGGCATQKSLYTWGNYQPQLYAYFKNNGTSPQAQLADLEKGLQVAASKGERIPPGYHAHMGLLYLNTGSPEKAVAALSNEV